MAKKEKSAMSDKWLPEIYYEETKEGLTNGLPFVKIPEDKSMPSAMFICEVRDAEDDMKDLAIHMFANMTTLKHTMSEEDYNKVRIALGLDVLSVAQEKGKEINDKIKNKIDV